MTFSRLSLPLLPLAAALALASLGSAAQAQGTPEQRAACAPDAIKLCPDTIPDVAATTACMRTHESELSPRCHAVFDAATQAPPSAERQEHRSSRAPDAGDDDAALGPRRYLYRTPNGDAAQTPDRSDRAIRPERQDREDEPDSDTAGYEGGGQGVREGTSNDGPDVDHARAEIGRLCEDGELDPRTCDTTQRSLGGER